MPLRGVERPTSLDHILSSTRPNLAAVEVSDLAERGAVQLCTPEHLAIQLHLLELEIRGAVLADGHGRRVHYVGPVQLRSRNRRRFIGAMAVSNVVLLEAIPMDAMDLKLRLLLHTVELNPESPKIPLSVAKRTAQPPTTSGQWCSVAGPAMLEGTVSALHHRAASSLPAESAADWI